MREKFNALMRFALNRETITYLIVGICTTAVSLSTYALYSRVFGMNEHLAKLLSMATAMVFAFYPNKVWVFRSKGTRGRVLLHEIWSFFSTRIASAFLEQGMFSFAVAVLRMHDILANAIVMSFIVVLNYLLGKFFVFRKKDEDELPV
ncbi:MAG: GtrA family protein [Defluviitaleaceae bacterium]|nr:GtrA family protein [Defluviitaleaceae bacterium]